MRLVTVQTPRGHAKQVAEIAFSKNISEVRVQQSQVLHHTNEFVEIDVVDIETSTPKAKEFIESLMTSSGYNPETYRFSIRHPDSIFASETIEKETYPIVRPTTDVYAELWQFSKITVSLVVRVFLSALLCYWHME